MGIWFILFNYWTRDKTLFKGVKIMNKEQIIKELLKIIEKDFETLNQTQLKFILDTKKQT